MTGENLKAELDALVTDGVAINAFHGGDSSMSHGAPRAPTLGVRMAVTRDGDLIGAFQGETLMLRLTALDHVGLKVTDMDRTLHFYQRLGLTLLRTSGPSADGLRSAVIRVGSQELNIFSHPDFASSGTENPVGMDHFCLIVDAASVDDVIADLRQVGIDVVRGPVERRDGMALFVHDPDGVRVELQLKKPTTA